MEKTSKFISYLILGILILLAAYYAFTGLNGSRDDSGNIPGNPSSSEENGAPGNDGDAISTEDADEGREDGASVPVRESTPQERMERTVSPSDAASYSDEDLPADF